MGSEQGREVVSRHQDSVLKAKELHLVWDNWGSPCPVIGKRPAVGILSVARAGELQKRPVPITGLSLERFLQGMDDLNSHSCSLKHPVLSILNTSTRNLHSICDLPITIF